MMKLNLEQMQLVVTDVILNASFNTHKKPHAQFKSCKTHGCVVMAHGIKNNRNTMTLHEKTFVDDFFLKQ